MLALFVFLRRSSASRVWSFCRVATSCARFTFARSVRFSGHLFCANDSFFLLKDRMKARFARVSRLLARRSSSLVVNRASGFQQRCVKLRSEGIIQKLALLYRERCADGARARGL